MPATTTTTLVLRISSTLASSRCTPATPTSLTRSTGLSVELGREGRLFGDDKIGRSLR